jgi:1-deoxy-D-xylulose-5-phosphate reductoisomerase
MRKLTILGATGSIGSSTLAVVSQNLDSFEVTALAAGSNVEKMFELCQQWRPKYAAMASVTAASQLNDLVQQANLDIIVLGGDDASIANIMRYFNLYLLRSNVVWDAVI